MVNQRTVAAAVLILLTASACEAQDGRTDSLTVDCQTIAARTPVLFVHGSGLSSASFGPMMDAFRAAGYPSDYLYAVDMSPSDGDNRRAAERHIAPAVDRLLDQSRRRIERSGCDAPAPSAVNIVSHSMGAFSARWFLRFINPERVRTFIALAGANHGTDRLCNRAGAGDRQMCPAYAPGGGAAAVQAQLNGSPEAPLDETPFGIGVDRPAVQSVQPDDSRRIAYFTVRLDPDEWIVPASSAALDGAGGIKVSPAAGVPVTETSSGNFLFTGDASHDGLPQDSRLIEFVLALLEQSIVDR